MSKEITESQFYMWRTIFALAHADDVVTNDEIRFMVEALEDVPFSEAQRRTLTDDIAEAQDIEKMFEKIEDANDQAEFFDFARKIVWADGDFGRKEREIILKLKQKHVKETDIDDLVGNVPLELEDEASEHERLDVKETMMSFRDNFMKRLFRD